MNLLDLARRMFGRNDPPSPPALRNKAGGMATILPHPEDSEAGARQIWGCAVKTVRLVNGSFWEIDPPVRFTLTTNVIDRYGVRGKPGDRVRVNALPDHALEPWKDTGITDEEVLDLFAPKQTEAA